LKNDCIEAVQEALGRNLRRGESDRIEAAVNNQMRQLARQDPEGWMAKSKWERLQEASQAAAAQLSEEANLKLKRLQLQIAAHDRIENAVADMFEKLPDNAKPGARLKAMSQLLAFDAGGKGARSVETNAHSIAQEAFGKMMPLWTSVKGFAHLFESHQGVSDLVHEMFGEDTGNAAAKTGAKVWRETAEELRNRANASGANIGELDGWHYPQSHSQSRVAQAGGNPHDPSAALERWISDVMPLLDRSKYVNADGTRMNEEKMHDFLLHAWESIVTDGVNKQEPGAGFGTGGIANRGSEHRQLLFKDADSYLKYQGLYGDRNLMAVLQGHVRSMARNIALMETLGPNPEKTFKYFNDRTRQDELRMNPAAANKVNSAYKLNQSLYDNVSGRSQVINQKIADVGQTFRNFETATKLGQVVITALGDEAGMSATAFANKIPWSEVLARELTYLNPAKGNDRAIAAHAGLGINSIIGGMNRFGTEDLSLAKGVGGTAKARQVTARLATATLGLSGAEAMWDMRRRALGSVLMSYLGKTVGKVEHFADLNVSDHGILANKGIDEKVWQTWRLAEPEDWGMKHGVLTPQSIRDIPDSALVHLGDPQTLRRNAATALLGHVLEEIGMGVMDSGIRERTRMNLGTTSGTVMGELARSTMLFKGFAASMMMKHWARAGTMGGVSSAQYAARLIVIGTILGGLATQLRNLAGGKDPANIAEPRFWGEAALRGGGMGFYGDFLYSELTSHDTSLIPALMGPLATEAETAWNLTGGNAFKAARGERTDETAALIRWGKSNIPVINNWYTKAAFDHLIWNNLQEASSPGYLDRMQMKAQATKGTTYWWDPHDSMPNAAPDFAKAWQPQRGEQQLDSIGRVASNLFPSLE
jgi:hypothetical protein